MSVSKYFGLEDHKAMVSSPKINKYRPERSINAHKWCQEIVDVRYHILKENMIDVLNFFFQELSARLDYFFGF